MHGHIYRPTWDPEGILSTILAIASVLLGILTGQWLRVTSRPRPRIQGLLLGRLWLGIMWIFYWRKIFIKI